MKTSEYEKDFSEFILINNIAYYNLERNKTNISSKENFEETNHNLKEYYLIN